MSYVAAVLATIAGVFATLLARETLRSRAAERRELESLHRARLREVADAEALARSAARAAARVEERLSTVETDADAAAALNDLDGL